MYEGEDGPAGHTVTTTNTHSTHTPPSIRPSHYFEAQSTIWPG